MGKRAQPPHSEKGNSDVKKRISAKTAPEALPGYPAPAFPAEVRHPTLQFLARGLASPAVKEFLQDEGNSQPVAIGGIPPFNSDTLEENLVKWGDLDASHGHTCYYILLTAAAL